jgi:hypothetical protein
MATWDVQLSGGPDADEAIARIVERTLGDRT